MNYKLLVLLVISGSLLGQTGNITFTNTLAQPIHYEYNTRVTQSVGGLIVKGDKGVNVLNRGDIPAKAQNFDIPSKLRLRDGGQIWGDTINFTLSRNSKDSQAFSINQLGSYTIGVDSNNKLTLTKN